MISNFFVSRPNLSIVLSLLVLVIGYMCYLSLPVTLYQLLGVPKVTISGTYPGASPQTIEDAVIRPIEEKLVNLNGIDFVEASANANGGVSVSATLIPVLIR